ncbi:perlwapin-like isoform X1 [Bufo gargarizans]|uniref:perlwapin-like isoform X1 n=1 Tax=Bufo gargarizans TaxID=30331 RepID=UPI001CF349A2|nr:perlwapin-like isoform X1 [Bufo gargarizans]
MAQVTALVLLSLLFNGGTTKGKSNSPGIDVVNPRFHPLAPVLCPPFGVINQCSTDADCSRDEICCSLCWNQCINILPLVDKPGICPQRRPCMADTLRSNGCTNDWQCPDKQKCCDTFCKRECTDPYIL